MAFHLSGSVQLERATVHHLEALRVITVLGCAVSIISCLILFYWLYKCRGEKKRPLLVHHGLVLATFLLSLCLSLTSRLANTGDETVCKIMGTLTHYSLLSTLSWMIGEMFYTFLLSNCVFNPVPHHHWVFYLVGFGIPAIPVCRLLSMGDIYGLRKIVSNEDVTSLYLMCWMLDSDRSRLAHYIINIGLLAVVVCSGAVMHLFVAVKIQNCPEWRKNRMSFLSIWGLACLFGTVLGLGLFNAGPLSEATLFLFCIINSCQGFFHMLRYCTLERMRKRRELNSDGGSTGSVMLQIGNVNI